LQLAAVVPVPPVVADGAVVPAALVVDVELELLSPHAAATNAHATSAPKM
jgi:hypothetical protein